MKRGLHGPKVLKIKTIFQMGLPDRIRIVFVNGPGRLKKWGRVNGTDKIIKIKKKN